MSADVTSDVRPRDQVVFHGRVARVVCIVQEQDADGFLVRQTPDSGWEFVDRADVHDVIPAEDRAPRDRVAECANCSAQ